MDFLSGYIRNLFNKSEEICSSDYLHDLTEAEKNVIRFYSFVRNTVVCFPFVRIDEECKHYYEIVFYKPQEETEECMEDEGDIYTRFIFAPGKRLNICEEDKLVEFLSSEDRILVDTKLYSDFISDIKLHFRNIHMIDYDRVENTLAHLYFAVQRGGIYELLFKAGLYNIAFYLPEIIDGLNILAKSPAELFEMPHRLLKLLNTGWGKEYLKEENREFAKAVYHRFSSCIGSVEGYSEIQWEYLCWLYEHDCKFDGRVYRYLEKHMYAESVDEYMKFLETANAVRGYYKFPCFPESREEYIATSSNVYELQILLAKESEYKRRISERFHLFERYIYIYEDDEKFVYAPRGLHDLCREAEGQKNNLLKYAKSIAEYGGTVIVFVRKKSNPSKPYVTIEIDSKSQMIVQAYGSCNRKLNENEKSWLDDYARKKGLTIKREEGDLCFDRPFWGDDGLPYA